MADVLYTQYKIRKSYFLTLDVSFDIRGRCVRLLAFLYARFDIRGSYLRTVDVLDARFEIREGRVRLVVVLY